MIVAIHQPQYLPWLGYFGKMLQSDVFCYLDTVQFKKNEWQNRNRIKTAQGWQWLTVPVTYRYPQRIGAVGIDNTADWARKHLQALQTNYRRAPFFESHFPAIEAVLRRRWESLSALNLELIECIRGILGIGHKPAALASAISASDEPTERLIDICRELGADTYLAGAGARAYMDAGRFARSGVRLLTQAFEHPVYPQRFNGFTPQLAIVDLIFNCGPESAGIIRAGNRPA
ncbi:MAG: WbqC family protein [Desulfobacterales bacterium]